MRGLLAFFLLVLSDSSVRIGTGASILRKLEIGEAEVIPYEYHGRGLVQDHEEFVEFLGQID